VHVVASSAWGHSRPKRPFLPREEAIRLGGGVIVAAVAGWFVSWIAPEGAVLVNVGAFFGALVCLLPRHHSRTASVVAGLVLIDGGAVLGVLLREHPLVALALLFVGLFVAGMARAVSVGAFMRLLFGAIALCSVAELSGSASSTSAVWPALAAFVLGQLIVAICACLNRPSTALADQRETTAELYRQLILLLDGESSRFVRARTLARESLDLISLLEFTDARWLRTLVDASDEIAATGPAGARPDDAQALHRVLDALASAPLLSPSGGAAPTGRSARSPGGAQAGTTVTEDLDVSAGVALALEATRPQEHSRPPAPLRGERPGDTARFYLRELRDLRGSSLRFALRIALTGVICQAVGQFLIEDLGDGLPFHGFWTLLAGCLIAMPDFHGTTGKAIARTAGSVVGAVLGTALSLVPFLQHGPAFLAVATVLVLAYLAARTISQATLMLVVVTWIAFLLGGEPAAFTRTIDTIIGAVIASLVFLLIPTWNADRLRDLFAQWCEKARAALTAAVVHAPTTVVDASTTEGAESRAGRRAFTDLVHAQRRFARAAIAAPLEPRADHSPWPLEDLPSIADSLDAVAVAILGLHHDAAAGSRTVADGSDRAGELPRTEPFAEWLGALAVHRTATVPEPPPGALHALWRELEELQELTVGPADG
jgi:hypothetical protein